MSEAKTYKVKEARNAGEKDNPHGGKLIKWYLDMESGESDVYTQKKPGNELKAGDEIYGRIEDGEYGPRFFSEQDPTGQSGGGGGGGGGSKFFKPKDPAEIRGMQRSHAQEMALRFAHCTGTFKELDFDDSKLVQAVLDEQLTPVVDWFDEDVSRATESLEEKIQNTAGALSTPPKERGNGNQPVPTKEVLQQAFKEYIEREGPDGRNKVKLKMTALGIEDYEQIEDDQAAELLKFFQG